MENKADLKKKAKMMTLLQNSRRYFKVDATLVNFNLKKTKKSKK